MKMRLFYVNCEILIPDIMAYHRVYHLGYFEALYLVGKELVMNTYPTR